MSLNGYSSVLNKHYTRRRGDDTKYFWDTYELLGKRRQRHIDIRKMNSQYENAKRKSTQDGSGYWEMANVGNEFRKGNDYICINLCWPQNLHKTSLLWVVGRQWSLREHLAWFPRSSLSSLSRPETWSLRPIKQCWDNSPCYWAWVLWIIS